MGYTVVSSTPSPYARKVRINLIEQGIPFHLQTEVPWNKDTQTPQHNPLEKLPILIETDDSNPSAPPRRVVYESSVILDYLNHSPPSGIQSFIPSEPDQYLAAKQLEALSTGICDALLIIFFEERRDEALRSTEWAARQQRKVDGGLKALNSLVENDSQNGFLVGGKLSIADIGVGSLLGFLSLRRPDHHWKKSYPALEKYWQGLEERESFKQTVPTMFQITDKVV